VEKADVVVSTAERRGTGGGGGSGGRGGSGVVGIGSLTLLGHGAA